MSSQIPYLDGNAAAGELSKVFAVDITAAEGQCGSCGATRRFAEAHLYMGGPGIVARCCVCEHALSFELSALATAYSLISAGDDLCSVRQDGVRSRGHKTSDLRVMKLRSLPCAERSRGEPRCAPLTSVAPSHRWLSSRLP